MKVCGANVRPERHKSDGSCEHSSNGKKQKDLRSDSWNHRGFSPVRMSMVQTDTTLK
ncbi:hypothetical protein NIES2104_34810 [Leptolyngbya sp. NIES-2104]|nr:hypothetical protein NIES2104_34810 [Leptolyngbya sp. NIES-2104]